MTALDNRFLSALRGRFADEPDAIFCRHVQSAGEIEITWARLERDCSQFLHAYNALGAKPGDQILIFLRHKPELYGSYFGAMLGGFVPSFMPCSSPRQDLGIYWSSHQKLLRHIQPVALVTSRDTLKEMREAGLELDGVAIVVADDLPFGIPPFKALPEDSIALLQHSSGTTGLKKGVALSYKSIVRQLESYATSIGLDRKRDVIVSWLPLYHDMGLIACLLLPAYFGVPFVHLDPFHWLSRPDLLFEHIRKRAGTLAWLPNFAFEHLTGTLARKAASFDLSNMRAFINCSEPCKAATFDRFALAFAPAGLQPQHLQCCYAMAETVFAVTQTVLDKPPARIHVDAESLDRGKRPVVANSGNGTELISTGTPISGIEIDICDEEGSSLPKGEIGEIVMRGEFLFSGYNRDPERSAERIRNGAYYSRDLGFLHDGSLYVLGRMDDLIIINGRNLYAHEIEAQVNAVDGVKPGRSAAVGVFDERIGSECLVVLVERQKDTKRADEEIRADIQSTVHSVFNVTPRTVNIFDEGRLIKTSSGKVSRKENLARFVRGVRQ